MTTFNISRIHTYAGIFRLSGELTASGNNTVLNYDAAEFMSTDGWCELDLTRAQTQQILERIKPAIIEHLAATPRTE
ncbi:hypothetical protein [Shewanella sp.]|uniref:hypothetical protein n=1 Tax=Shewanella sp. TaxID=50422 RepID=UPI003A971672